MWEELKVYNQLEKKSINSTFVQFGKLLYSLADDYLLDQSYSIIKLFKINNHLEQAIFIEKDKSSYHLQVCTSIKPIDFYKKHKYTMLNIVSLGNIMNNYRKSSYPLTQEWRDLAVFLSQRIKIEVRQYFENFNSYDKIIEKRKEIEPTGRVLENNYELLIYAAIKTRNSALLLNYLDKKISNPVMRITMSEYLKPDKQEIDEMQFLNRIKQFAQQENFENIEKEIATFNK